MLGAKGWGTQVSVWANLASVWLALVHLEVHHVRRRHSHSTRDTTVEIFILFGFTGYFPGLLS